MIEKILALVKKLVFNPTFIFVFLFLGMSLLYEYQKVIFFRPQSVHFWRQSDCASQALNYYQNGMHFGKPEIHNQVSDEKRVLQKQNLLILNYQLT
jgi:hypothetical protein